jgi:hydroxypyruvate isomerase
MPRFAANLSMMFNEYPFLDRFGAAADHGFTAVEYLFPYEFAPDDIAKRLSDHGLTQALFNFFPGDFAKGERGFAALPDRAADLTASIPLALRYAKATGVKRLHLMTGHAERNARTEARFKDSLKEVASALGAEGIDLLIEPLNRRDNPGYFLTDFAFAAQVIDELKLPNLKLQFDIYHRQILHGDVTKALAAMMPIIGHVQTASVPLRHEPNTGELNDDFIFASLDRLGYDGYVGCEYRPRAGTIAGLGWMAPHRARR